VIVWPLKRPDIFKGLRAPPKGLMLFGPPGTGKTMIGKAIASEISATFFSISASSITSKWVGEGEKLVRVLFALAVKNQPSVIFIDEIDSLLSSRSDNEQEASRRIKTEFLVHLDGVATNPDDRILLIGATNRPDELDSAMQRRLAKRMYIPLPNAEGRLQILKNLLKGVKNVVNDRELEIIVNRSKGYSGSDMKNLCTEACMFPLRNVFDISSVRCEDIPPVGFSDFELALDVIKPSVSGQDVLKLLEWNQKFGSFRFDYSLVDT
jgi:SpoVK/Ycf46/Vps4 family AAA+-type ATPase